MKIAIFGATGAIGHEILTEALSRGHHVTAVVRDPARLTVTNENLTVVVGDATDAASVAGVVKGQDAVVGSISGRRDGDANLIVVAANALISGVAAAGVSRLIWVGGAGSLEAAPGVRVMDSPDFPEAYRAEANAGAEVLEAFWATASNLDWSYLSPAAVIAPGERTGKFRLGGDQMVVDAEGNSRISTQDYAIAIVDELENPEHIKQRFTVGY